MLLLVLLLASLDDEIMLWVSILYHFQAAAHTNCLQILDARPRLNAHANVLLLGKGIDDVDRVAEDGKYIIRTNVGLIIYTGSSI